MAFMQLAADSAFEIQFPGEQVPFTLRPGNDNTYGIIFSNHYHTIQTN